MNFYSTNKDLKAGEKNLEKVGEESTEGSKIPYVCEYKRE